MYNEIKHIFGEILSGEYGGKRFLMEIPDWEYTSEQEFEVLKRCAVFEHDATFEDWTENGAGLTKEGEKYWCDVWPRSKIRNLTMFGELLEELGKIEKAYCYPWRDFTCGECNGTGRGLQGGMRGAVYTQADFDEDPDFEERYFGGYYDGECCNCGGKGYFREHQIQHDFDIYGDSRNYRGRANEGENYDDWIIEHRKVCPLDRVRDQSNQMQRRPEDDATRAYREYHLRVAHEKHKAEVFKEGSYYIESINRDIDRKRNRCGRTEHVKAGDPRYSEKELNRMRKGIENTDGYWLTRGESMWTRVFHKTLEEGQEYEADSRMGNEP